MKKGRFLLFLFLLLSVLMLNGGLVLGADWQKTSENRFYCKGHAASVLAEDGRGGRTSGERSRDEGNGEGADEAL